MARDPPAIADKVGATTSADDVRRGREELASLIAILVVRQHRRKADDEEPEVLKSEGPSPPT